MTSTVRRRSLLAATLSLPAWPALAQAADPLAPVHRFVGQWSGKSSGASGDADVNRQYTLVLRGRYLHETNVSAYPPQEKNKTGERHEHWSMFSWDRQRKCLVLRQFHVESFVNTFRQTPDPEQPSRLVFDSESFENFSNLWKARETYEFSGDDAFVEVFELAAPGKDFQVYSRTQLSRIR